MDLRNSRGASAHSLLLPRAIRVMGKRCSFHRGSRHFVDKAQGGGHNEKASLKRKPQLAEGFTHRACARVAELADALASGASDRKVVEVRVLSRAPSFAYVHRWNVVKLGAQFRCSTFPFALGNAPLTPSPSRLRANRRTPRFLVNNNGPPYVFCKCCI